MGSDQKREIGNLYVYQCSFMYVFFIILGKEERKDCGVCIVVKLVKGKGGDCGQLGGVEGV